MPYATFSDPQSLNQYSYVRNIPTTRFDPDGHKDGDCGWWCRVKERFHNSNVGLGFRTNAEVKTTAQHMREAATPGSDLAYRDPNTGKIAVYTADQLSKLSDADAVKLWDTVFPGQDGDQPAQGITAIGIFTTTFGPNNFEKPVASDQRLQGIIDKLYQDTDTILGGTAGAVRQELATGQQVAGHWHSQDAGDTIKQLNNFLKNNQGLSQL